MTGFDGEAFAGRWHQMSLAEQMGNIGSEFDRIVSWRKKNNPELAGKAFDRTLALIDLSMMDSRWRWSARRELARVRELICDALVGDNHYNTPLEFFSKYFYQFALVARRNR